MSVWRPSERIRVKVLGLIWNENRLLAAEVKQDDGVVKGIRPPGGTVEFCETREQALERGAQHVDHPEHRARRLAGGVGQRRQRMEGAVQVGGAIHQHQGGFCGHGGHFGMAAQGRGFRFSGMDTPKKRADFRTRMATRLQPSESVTGTLLDQS
jgi:hypothetical protein